MHIIALNHEQIKKDPQRITKIKPFIDQYKWKEINFLSHKNDWNEFGKNNKTTALNILYLPHNTEEIRHAYKSKHLSRENQAILLMITDGKKWHYLVVRSLFALLRGITSNHNGDLYCFIVFIHIVPKIDLKNIKMSVKVMIIVM